MRLLRSEGKKKLSDRVARALRTESYATDVAEGGAAGCSLAETDEYDLIILDLRLPGLKRAELVKRFRRKNPAVPILPRPGPGRCFR